LIAFTVRVLAVAAGLILAIALLGIAVKAWAPGLDIDTAAAVVAHRTATLTAIARFATSAGSFAVVAPLALLVMILRRARWMGDGIPLLIITAGSGLIPGIVKELVARPRPTLSPVYHLLTLSFPSQHATQAAAVYLALALVLSTGSSRLLRSAAVAIAILIALAVAATRVYLGVHYLTDVVAGLLLGWSWALLVLYWARLPLTRSVAGPVTAANSAATD
jgi:membrane-associated phospholipid phosphatase